LARIDWQRGRVRPRQGQVTRVSTTFASAQRERSSGSAGGSVVPGSYRPDPARLTTANRFGSNRRPHCSTPRSPRTRITSGFIRTSVDVQFRRPDMDAMVTQLRAAHITGWRRMEEPSDWAFRLGLPDPEGAQYDRIWDASALRARYSVKWFVSPAVKLWNAFKKALQAGGRKLLFLP